MTRLTELWRDVKTGRSALAVVHGDAGIGKTRFAQEFADRAARGGARVLWGNCVELREAGLTYAPFRQALRDLGNDAGLKMTLGDLLPRLTGLLDESAAIDHHGPRPGTLFEMSLVVFRSLARIRPVLLVIEDIHLADNTTLDLLTYLARNLTTEPLLGLLTSRVLPESPGTANEHGHRLAQFLAGQTSNAVAQWIRLKPLDEHKTAELLEVLTGHTTTPAEIHEIFIRSDGNPMFVEEVVRARVRGDGQLSPNLRQLLRDRVRELGDQVRDLLSVAAVAGQRVARNDLRAVADIPRDTFSRLLGSALDASVLVEEEAGKRYAFRQTLLQEVLYEDLPSDRRRELHRRYADVLETRGHTRTTAPGAVATHWDRAGYPDRALPAYLAAADAARRAFAFAESEQFLQRADELWDRVEHPETLSGVTRRHLANKTIEQAIRTEDLATAVRMARTALHRAEATSDERVVAFQRMQLAQALWFSGEEGAAIEDTQKATEAVLTDGPSREQGRIFAWQASVHAIHGRYADAAVFARRALEAARRSGAPRTYRYAMLLAGTAAAAQGDLPGGLELIDQADDLARRRNDPDEVMRIILHRGRVFQRYARWEQARRVYLDGLEAAPKYGMTQRYAWRFHVLAARMSFFLGRWDEASRQIELARTQISGRDAALPSLLVSTGRFAEGQAFYARPRANWRSDGTGRLQVPEGPVELATWLWRLDDARAACAAAMDSLAGSEELIPEARLCRITLRAEAEAVERGEITATDASEHAAPFIDRLRALHTAHPPRSDGYGTELEALTVTAEAEWLRIANQPDPDAWGEAAAHWDALAMPYPYAYARWQQSEALRRHHGHDRLRVTALRNEAQEEAKRLGAHPLMDAITGRRPKDHGGGPTSSALNALTPREREVVALLAQGHSNRHIASALGIAEGTVSVHVSRILRKLGASSRGQVIAMLAGGNPTS